MLFNSLEFLLFFPIVFILYWFVFNKSLKFQNVLLLAASYFFYAWWDWRFLFLLLFSTIIDYSFGILIHKHTGRKKSLFLWLAVANNLLFLGFFKYYNFFVESATSLLHHAGFQVHPYFLNIALPIGISFYTFHGMSYVFDIYREKAKPVINFVNYALFVCFFPLLVAGPIERATHLLPQVQVKRFFKYPQAVAGLRLILWGFFKKSVIADSSASLVNTIFNGHQGMTGFALIAGVVFFAFQIYGDFSGYSDIAIGTAKLLGFELIINFNFPFYSKSVSEFWRRWHISLYSWFMDYVYTPMTIALRDWGKPAVFFSMICTFMLSGLWHGAAGKFIFFGFLQGMAISYEILTAKGRKKLMKKTPPWLYNFFARLLTFTFLLLTFVLFRAATAREAFRYIGEMFTHPFYRHSDINLFIQYAFLPLLFLFLLMVEWINRESNSIVPFFGKMRNKFVRYSFYLTVFVIIVLLGTFEKTAFIYFKF